MKLGIVGHEAAKFTAVTREHAKAAIRAAILNGADEVISGRSPLGGIDVWAEEIAEELGVKTRIFPPKARRWDGPGGFKARNLEIAAACELCLVIVVRELPPGYTGMRFKGCYHCHDRVPAHVKSGGCWTAWRAPARAWQIVDEQGAYPMGVRP